MSAESGCAPTSCPGSRATAPPNVRRWRRDSKAEEHRLAYEQFRGTAVWRRGMDVRVPLPSLLAAADAAAAAPAR